MKVIHRNLKTPKSKQPCLRDFEDGTVVRLRRRLNTNADISDPVLLVNMQSYSLYCRGRDYNAALYPGEHFRKANNNGKRVILNLATGTLSCVDNTRECDSITAEVHTS